MRLTRPIPATHGSSVRRRRAPFTRRLAARVLLSALASLTACARDADPRASSRSQDTAIATRAPLTVFAAGSLARPMRALLDSFQRRSGATYTLETAGSLELARRLLELGKVADIVALADEEVFPRLLMPAQVSWYARFARNRLVLAHASGAPGLADALAGNWPAALQRKGVEVGRSDPDLDPAGYRTLMLFQLAERHYHDAGLGARLEANSARRHVRPKSAELVALLQAREIDYAWMYESSARGARLPFIAMPAEIDLGSESMAERYRVATVRVLGGKIGDTLALHGTPIRYGLTIPRAAAEPERAAQFLRFLFSAPGLRVLRGEFLDAVSQPTIVGVGAPAWLDALATSAKQRDTVVRSSAAFERRVAPVPDTVQRR